MISCFSFFLLLRKSVPHGGQSLTALSHTHVRAQTSPRESTNGDTHDEAKGKENRSQRQNRMPTRCSLLCFGVHVLTLAATNLMQQSLGKKQSVRDGNAGTGAFLSPFKHTAFQTPAALAPVSPHPVVPVSSRCYPCPAISRENQASSLALHSHWVKAKGRKGRERAAVQNTMFKGKADDCCSRPILTSDDDEQASQSVDRRRRRKSGIRWNPVCVRVLENTLPRPFPSPPSRSRFLVSSR